MKPRRGSYRMRGPAAGALVLLLAAAGPTRAAGPLAAPEPYPGDLPPLDAVQRVLKGLPQVQAAQHGLVAAAAERQALDAGRHEWNVRLGAQQRQVRVAPEQRFQEWDVGLERPLRLPGKAEADRGMGREAVAQAEAAHGDALHESARALLKVWFDWQRERGAARLWGEQAALLARQAAAVSRRAELGDASRLEALQAEAAQAQADTQLLQAVARRDGAESALRLRFAGLPLDAPPEPSTPRPPGGTPADWEEEILAHNHELMLAAAATRHAGQAALRADRDRTPDPAVGVRLASERGGEERLVGLALSLPLPGAARRATAMSAAAQSEAAALREAAVLAKVRAEARLQAQQAAAAHAAWEKAEHALLRHQEAARLAQRAWELGEGTLADLLQARRLANDTSLATLTSRLDALEAGYRLRLDAHRLWPLEEPDADGAAH